MPSRDSWFLHAGTSQPKDCDIDQNRYLWQEAGVPNRNVNLSMSHVSHLIIPFAGEMRVAA